MEREPVFGSSVFLIRDFLPGEECAAFVAASEAEGYEDAPITTLSGAVRRTDVRDNQRVLHDDPALAEAWFQRARPFLPERQGKWRLTGFNERFRFYRYDPGQSFKRHYDGSYHRSASQCSLLTFMVYLNDDFTGGTTDFYDAFDRPRASVIPARGAALVFDHQQVHEGAAVETGRKYVLRTDVMYSRTG